MNKPFPCWYFPLVFNAVAVLIHLCVICDHFSGLMSLFQGHITCKNLTLLKFIQKILKAVLMKINFMSKTSLTNTKVRIQKPALWKD